MSSKIPIIQIGVLLERLTISKIIIIIYNTNKYLTVYLLSIGSEVEKSEDIGSSLVETFRGLVT